MIDTCLAVICLCGMGALHWSLRDTDSPISLTIGTVAIVAIYFIYAMARNPVVQKRRLGTMPPNPRPPSPPRPKEVN